MNGYELLLVIDGMLQMNGFGQIAVVLRLDEVSRVGTVEFLDGDIRVFQRIIERHTFCQYLFTIELEGLAGFLVDVRQDAFCIVIGHVDHRRREDGLITQHVVLGLPLVLQLFRLVVHHSYQHGGLAILRAPEH